MPGFTEMKRPEARIAWPPPLGPTGHGIAWREAFARWEIEAWPVFCWLFLAAAIAALFLPNSVALWALGSAVIFQVFTCSLVEFPTNRYSAPGAPALLAVAAAVPLHLLGRAACWLGSRRS